MILGKTPKLPSQKLIKKIEPEQRQNNEFEIVTKNINLTNYPASPRNFMSTIIYAI